MIVFIVPFKAKKDCVSWSVACNLLNATLQSICSQTQPNFKVVCCVTDRPTLTFRHDSINFVEYYGKEESGLRLDLRRKDKANKILKAFDYAKRFSPSYLMVVDADDFISNKIVDFILSEPLSDGFVVANGFVYEKEADSFLLLKKTFHMHCGSALIASPKIANSLITFTEYSAWYNHQARGLTLKLLPFAGAIYNTMHGENLSAVTSIRNRPIFDFIDVEHCSFTDDIKKEFTYCDVYSTNHRKEE